MKPFLAHMIGAGRLNVATYEFVEADTHSTAGATIIVVLSSLAAALGSGMDRVSDLAGLVLVAVLSWLVWVALTYWIGTKLLPMPETQATFGQVLRTTGFSASPGVLRIFGFLPVVGWLIFLGATFWMLIAFVIAVRQALDFQSTGRAFLVCTLGWLIHGLVMFAFVMKAL